MCESHDTLKGSHLNAKKKKNSFVRVALFLTRNPRCWRFVLEFYGALFGDFSPKCHSALSVFGARTRLCLNPPVQPLLLLSFFTPIAQSANGLYLSLLSFAGSPRRHWYVDSADNDIHCLHTHTHHCLVWGKTPRWSLFTHRVKEITQSKSGFYKCDLCVKVIPMEVPQRRHNGHLPSQKKPPSIKHYVVAFRLGRHSEAWPRLYAKC